MVVEVGFLKLGNIGSAVMAEFLLDERAEREDIDVRVVSSGAKMNVEQAEDIVEKIMLFKPSFVVVTSPNAALPGPGKVRELLKNSGVPSLIISDGPAKKAVKQIEEMGLGYIVVEADAMLGARREFLDPVEMAIFNANIIKVLAVTGAYSSMCSEIDKIIEAFKKGESPSMPRLVIDKEKAIAASNLQNPYAKAKAMAAYEMARRVADLAVEGCFVVKEWERYTGILSASHEMMHVAATLADEARSIEKSNDTVIRTPHYDDGTVLSKTRLIEKPQKPTKP